MVIAVDCNSPSRSAASSRRPDGSRLYVQHRLAERLAELWPLLDRGQTYLYICGLKGMERGIGSTLREYALAAGLDGNAWHDGFRKSGRWLVETY